MKKRQVFFSVLLIGFMFSGNHIFSQSYDKFYDRQYFDILSDVLQEINEDRIQSKQNASKNAEQLAGLESYINSNPMVKYASLEMGKPYSYGSMGPNEYDCSGLMVYIFEKAGKKIPRTSAEQGKSGTLVLKEELQSGDLVFFDTRSLAEKSVDSTSNARPESKDIVFDLPTVAESINKQSIDFLPEKITHVGIYVGEQKFIHASSDADKGVMVDSLNSKYYSSRYLFAKRY